MAFMVPPAALSQPSPLLISSSRSRNLPKRVPERARLRRKISLPRLPSRMLGLGDLALGGSEEDEEEGNGGGDEETLLEEDEWVGGEEVGKEDMERGFRYTVVEVDGEGEEYGGGQQRDEGRVVQTLGRPPGCKQDASGARIGRSVRFASHHTPSTGLDGHVTPDMHSTHSDDTLTPSTYVAKLPDPIGKWRCCKCKKGHDVYSFAQGIHPVSVLNCVCTHRSCWACTLDGMIKPFEPMNDPEVVQLSEDGHKQVRFGVFCDGCGLSWRAQEIGTRLGTKASALQRISAIPKLLVRRGGHPLQKLRHSQSMSNLSAIPSTCPRLFHSQFGASRSALNLRALSNEMAKGHGKQAEFATVKFIGIQCTCGLTTDVTSLCFQVVDPPMDLLEAKAAEPSVECNGPNFTSTPVDQARGHGTPIITLKGGEHPNPLMSNPPEGDFGQMA